MNRESSNIPGHLHFLTFSCLKKQRLLTDDQTCLWLAEALDKARRAEEFDLWAYVFMPEHVHLSVRPRRSEYSMAKILRRIKEPFTHRVVRRWTECDQARLQLITTSLGSRALHCFWQPGGGFDRNLRSIEEIGGVVEYIEFNPVRRGLAKDPTHWAWSSARARAGMADVPLVPDEIRLYQ